MRVRYRLDSVCGGGGHYFFTAETSGKTLSFMMQKQDLLEPLSEEAVEELVKRRLCTFVQDRSMVDPVLLRAALVNEEFIV